MDKKKLRWAALVLLAGLGIPAVAWAGVNAIEGCCPIPGCPCCPGGGG